MIWIFDLGDLYTWGRDEGEGRLGLGPGRGPDQAGGLSIPSKVKALPVPVAAVSCGGFFTMALTEDGHLWNWGGKLLCVFFLAKGGKIMSFLFNIFLSFHVVFSSVDYRKSILMLYLVYWVWVADLYIWLLQHEAIWCLKIWCFRKLRWMSSNWIPNLRDIGVIYWFNVLLPLRIEGHLLKHVWRRF